MDLYIHVHMSYCRNGVEIKNMCSLRARHTKQSFPSLFPSFCSSCLLRLSIHALSATISYTAPRKRFTHLGTFDEPRTSGAAYMPVT